MTRPAIPESICRTARCLACSVALLALVACGGSKNFYAGADARADRAAADAEAGAPVANATIETQSTYIKLVEQMQSDGLWFASLAHLDALERRWGVVPATTRLRADALRHTDQIDESRRQYQLLKGTPMEAAALHGLGLIAGSEGNYPLAVQLLESARQLSPTDGLLLSDVGYANMRAGRLANARVPVMQAAQLLPNNLQVRVNLALYLVVSNQDDQAETLMTTAAFSPATRTAIRKSALELRALPAEPEPSAASPLDLRAATTLRRVHIHVRDTNVAPAPASPLSNESLP
jgi:Flp pilus assembly protein TadD